MRKNLLSILFLFLSVAAFGQIGQKIKKKIKDINPRNKYPSGINVYAFGPIGFAALTYDYFIVSNFAIEGGFGYRQNENSIGFTGGGRYHFLGKAPLRATVYLGIYNAVGPRNGVWEYYNLYIPLGINRIHRNQFNWSLEVAYQRNATVGSFISGGIKIGPRFRIFNK